MAGKKLSELKEISVRPDTYVIRWGEDESSYNVSDLLNDIKSNARKRFNELPPKKQLYYACNINKLIDFLFELK